MESKREIGIGYVLLTLVFLFVSMWYTIVYLDSYVVQIPLLATAVVAAFIAFFHKYKWKDIIDAVMYGINIALEGLIILLIIGVVIGSWVASGTVQSIVVYGLELLNPDWFLPVCLVITSLTALATGSAWTTGGTVGVALMSIGVGLGFDAPLVAGVVISGAFFGDKLSPLSDNTNVVSAATGVNLFDHVRHTAFTAIPGILICLVIYTIIGLIIGDSDVAANTEAIDATITSLKDNFTISPILLIPPMFIVVLAYFKVPAIPSLLFVALLGFVLGSVVQGFSMNELFSVFYEGFSPSLTPNLVDEAAVKIVSRGGLSSMYYNMSLAMCALAFAGIMEKTGMLKSLIASLHIFLKTRVLLVITTMLTSWLTNLAMASQHMAMIVPGRMYLPAYKDHKLKVKNLSRTLADSGGLSAPLVPWGLSGVFMAGSLGVATVEYIPFVLFSFVVPIITIIYAITGITFEYESEDLDEFEA